MKSTLTATFVSAFLSVTAPALLAQDTLKSRPAQVSFVPGLSTNGFRSGAFRQPFSLNVVGGINGGSSAVEIGSVFNVDKVFVKGVQLAGAVNVSGGTVQGTQMAGAVNVARGDVSGVQVSGAVNLARKDMKGLQLGVVNLAGKNKGLQVGVINIADSSAGVTLGLINIVRKGGVRDLEVWGSETFYLNGAFKMGSKKLYTLLAAGGQVRGEGYRWGLGIGLGSRVASGAKADLSVDALGYQVMENEFWDRKPDYLLQLRTVASTRLAGKVRIFAGPTFNLMLADQSGSQEKQLATVAPYTLYEHQSASRLRYGWVGVNIGVRL